VHARRAQHVVARHAGAVQGRLEGDRGAPHACRGTRGSWPFPYIHILFYFIFIYELLAISVHAILYLLFIKKSIKKLEI
jgi:hypothetical protein